MRTVIGIVVSRFLARARASIRISPLLLGFAFFAAPAWALEGWIGEPTPADFFRENAQGAINDAIKIKGESAKFANQIQAAREAYFMASPANRTAAGAKFQKFLFDKDIFFASIPIVGGMNAHTAAVGKLTAALNRGREIDGGIPNRASDSFKNWIISMRGELGARGDEILINLDADKFQKALLATQPQYAKYRAERDQFEIDRWRGQHPTQEERDRKLPLRISRPFPPSTFLRLKDAPPLFKEELKKSDGAGALMLNCEYGPFLDENGDQSYRGYLFWKSRPPENVAWLMARGPAEMSIVLDRVIEACPGLEADARTTAKAPQKIFQTEEIKKQAHAESDAQWKASRKDIFGRPKVVPLTPQEQSEARQVAQERAAKLRVRQSAATECITAFNSERKTDPTGARDRLSECTRAVQALPSVR